MQFVLTNYLISCSSAIRPWLLVQDYYLSRFSPFTLICTLLSLIQFLQSSSQSLLSAVQLLLHQLDPAVQRCHLGLRLVQQGKEKREREKGSLVNAEELCCLRWKNDLDQQAENQLNKVTENNKMKRLFNKHVSLNVWGVFFKSFADVIKFTLNHCDEIWTLKLEHSLKALM